MIDNDNEDIGSFYKIIFSFFYFNFFMLLIFI